MYSVMQQRIPLFLFLTWSILCISCNSKEKVDLIVHHAKVYTVDSSFSVQSAFAVKDGKFVAIGDDQDILDKYTSANTVDAAGKPIYPGFYDAHCHFFHFAHSLHEVDLVDVPSEEELVKRVQLFRKQYPDDPWIIGQGWDQNKWDDKSFPTNEKLNELFPETPIYLSRIDGHAALANDKALSLAGITDDTKMTGGLVVQKAGKPTGVLVDNAMDLVQAKIPAPNEEAMTRMLLEAEKACFQVGLTTLGDAGLSLDQIALLRKLYREQQLHIRDYAMIAIQPHQLDSVLQAGIYTSDQLDVRSFKIVGDGALGSRGACLLEPYSDDPSKGFLLLPPAMLDSAVAKIANSDFQLNVHAIGDSTNRLVLDLFNKYLSAGGDRRWRVEHAQVIAPSDFSKFSPKGIIPSVQPTHATSDMFWALDRLGTDRLKGAYAYKQLLDETGLVALGSDFPVEHINPLYGFHAAVARVNQENKPAGGFQMENALSREEALKGMTIWAAYASFHEKTRGSIENGKLADFVLLDEDIMEIPENRIRQVKVSSTYLGGKRVH
ncbi:amidohydrolase [Olivibacter sitiensis]|uniref:amidohydrolase n=1 Tax=Olivibacter sitiensis TaxID=376470 RepID=UPI001FE0878D|nr:amidohydrolase [Olivibacter sitiensis]